jgi:RNA polymerase sigma-70 factor (ECF subfamily)
VSEDEKDWIIRSQKHDDEAFAHLVELYQKPVYNLCFRMLGEAGEAEDAAQESFWRAYQALKRYDPQRPFITWLLSIAAHYCIDQIRKRRAVVIPIEILPEGDIRDNMPTPESHFSRREEQQQVRRLLECLGPEDRAAIVMSYWHEMSDQEISQALSISVSAVKSRLFRARRELAQRWQADQRTSAGIERRQHESPAF